MNNRLAMNALRVAVCAAAAAAGVAKATADDCTATPLPAGSAGKNVRAWKLADGAIAAWAGMNINIDGYARAYHRNNRDAGAVLHLCVGGRVHLPDGTVYEGSQSNATCTGKFMDDVARIEAAGWADPSVGVVEWYGIVADGSAMVGGRKVSGITPVLQRDGSGFYVSPTSLVDKRVTDAGDQRRYPNPLRVAAAVVPGGVRKASIGFGSFGVAIDPAKQHAVPFVVGDAGPAVGEGSPALARQVAGLAPSDEIDIKSRFTGQVSAPQVLWVFFGGPGTAFDHEKEGEMATQGQAAFEQWGGAARLAQCVQSLK